MLTLHEKHIDRTFIIIPMFTIFKRIGEIHMIKIRVEATENEVAKIIEILEERFAEIEVSGVYDLPNNRSRAYIDISRIV